MFMQRKRWNKDSFIYLTEEEWEKLAAKTSVIQTMIRLLCQDNNSEEMSVSGEEWRLSELRKVAQSIQDEEQYLSGNL